MAVMHSPRIETATSVFTRDQILTAAAQVDALWVESCVRRFESVVTDRDFPCIYAMGANPLFAFVETVRDPRDRLAIHRTITEYLRGLSSIADLGLRARTMLVLFERPREKDTLIADYERDSWELLQYLLDSDDDAWPEYIPLDPDTPRWEFCFANTPLFLNICTPAHHARRSRNLGPALTFVIQPREGIDFCAPPNNEGDAARSLIRARINKYDSVGACQDFAVYGSPANREWKYYFLPDDSSQTFTACPIDPRKRKTDQQSEPGE